MTEFLAYLEKTPENQHVLETLTMTHLYFARVPEGVRVLQHLSEYERGQNRGVVLDSDSDEVGEVFVYGLGDGAVFDIRIPNFIEAQEVLRQFPADSGIKVLRVTEKIRSQFEPLGLQTPRPEQQEVLSKSTLAYFLFQKAAYGSRLQEDDLKRLLGDFQVDGLLSGKAI